MKYQAIIDQMTLEEKIALCSGSDFFSTKEFEGHNIPTIVMSDGPHGLRKQILADDHLGINQSVPSTSFPTASLSACSWDRELLEKMGAAIGAEAQQEGVLIVLGPGLNIKRNPLCGRNFEYFSEDPFLSGELTSSWVKGLQGQGVGASLKHFAVNNQETDRMSSDSLVDERTLREIYLTAFEKAVKQSNPVTVMSAYNKVNGVFCSEHNYLLREILRDEWGYTGIVVTDWGAMHNRIAGIEAGLDLEMPGSSGYFDQEVLHAVKSGSLAEDRIDEIVDRVIDMSLSLTAKKKDGYQYNLDHHHQLAQTIASSSAVLMQNEDNLLPLQSGQSIALVGAMAKTPRYQGTGSSHINPTRLASVIDGFNDLGLEYSYYAGYTLKGASSQTLIEEAVEGAKKSDVVVIFAGLTDDYESEAFDRADLKMPESHNRLIRQVAEVNPNIVVALVGGAPVEMPWLSQAKAILNLYLSGQAGGLATAELLTGKVNPSGKLAETYPVCYEDIPSSGFYEAGGKQAQYREGIYVGYRYFDTAEKGVLFPFGHGLSYTSFTYNNLKSSQDQLTSPYELQVSCNVTNSGSVDGAEVVQLYIRHTNSQIFRPQKELKEFTKVFLKAGETKQITINLDERSFAIYDPDSQGWIVESGIYQILVGASSRDIRLTKELEVQGVPVESKRNQIPDWYFHLEGQVTQADFETLIGKKIPHLHLPQKGHFTLNHSFQDMQASFMMRIVAKVIEMVIASRLGGVEKDGPAYRLMVHSALTTPLKSLTILDPQSMPKQITTGLVQMANGQIVKGILTMLNK